MNTNQLKKFAQDARKKLLAQVGAKLSFVLTTDSSELREKAEQVSQLREELGRISKEQLIEKVAYTWFNRLMALRFMDANDYQPLGIRVITPKEGYTTAELLDEAKRGNIPDELKLKRQKVYDLLDNRIPSTNPQNEAYKELLIAACNHLNTVFPFLFEKISDYTELLLPDDLTSDFSIVTDVLEGMPMEDCSNVEIIGWLYQFYISEEKDRLINAKKVYKSYEIAPVTQLFTPKWIVQYMVDNTLGQLWKEARPKTKITKDLEFYIKPENEAIIPNRDVKSPEELTFFDPCVGSAHILCYAFDVFFKIYEEEGYSTSEIPEHIITKNLFGIDIDDRAAQLAGFALMMKGRQYNRRLLRKAISPNITSFQNIESHPKFRNAKTLGSLISIDKSDVDNIVIDTSSIFTEQQLQLRKQASLLANRYDILVTNPPYLNSTYMDGLLKQYLLQEFPSTKSDLFASFLVKASIFTKSNGLIGYICPYVWMFLSSYVELRKLVISESTISSLVQLEYNAFEPAVVPIASFILRNQFIKGYKGSYVKLSDFTGSENQAPKTLEAIKNPNCGWFYSFDQADYYKISGFPIAFSVGKGIINAFEKGEELAKFSELKTGMSTGDNQRFQRFWYETAYSSIGFEIKNNVETKNVSTKWYPCKSGGSFRKWFGNNELVVNWENDGYEIRNLFNGDNKLKSRPQNIDYYFRRSLTWSKITSYRISLRYNDFGFAFDAVGLSAFIEDENILYIQAILNSNLAHNIFNLLNQSMSIIIDDLRRLPIIFPKEEPIKSSIENLCRQNINISEEEWNSHECSWCFRQNELIRFEKKDLTLNIEEVFEIYQQYWKTKFFRLHQNEEEINCQLNDLYSLLDEVPIEIKIEDVTILREELNRKILTETNQKLIRNIDTKIVRNYQEISLNFITEEIISQFVSYAVGCMFGRYSLDKEGLILANQGETLHNYLLKIEMSANDCIFMPDEDNIIPVLDNEWFEDDITGRFYEFLKVTFGEKNFNKNLTFIEEQLGKDIRKYLTKDFYPDHIKRYKKSPIYWMFSSPKGSFNVLIYMHRYTPDTVSNILNNYLKEFIGKLKTRKETLQHIQVNGSASEKTKAIKENDSIDKMLIELHEYERDILFPMATERIAIDLDDGVLVNYNKFGKAVKEVTGLNDKATKKKVMEFDWIDATQIR